MPKRYNREYHTVEELERAIRYHGLTFISHPHRNYPVLDSVDPRISDGYDAPSIGILFNKKEKRQLTIEFYWKTDRSKYNNLYFSDDRFARLLDTYIEDPYFYHNLHFTSPL